MSTTNRGRKRQAPTESSKCSDTNDNLSADDGMSVPGTATYDETFSQISGGKRRRKKFSSQRRDEVAKVRKVGACKDCRARKVRCLHALQGPDTHPTPAPAPAPKPSHQPFHFDFETSFPEITYPGPIWENDAEQWPQPDEAQLQDPSFNEGADLIASVPASTARQERLALDLDDIDNIIGDNSGGSVAQEWGQKSQWVINATTLTNKQQYSRPSTTAYSYSNPNFSIDAGPLPSTPASSNADLNSPNTQDVGHYRCNVQGCDDRRVFTEEIQLRRHQEIKHADLFQPQITYACHAVECRTKRYGTMERLQAHIKCTHPEILESPAQLPISDVSERDTQPDRRAQVNDFIAGQYLAGMEDNSTAIPDQKTSEEAYLLTTYNWLQEKASKRARSQRVHRNPSIRRSVSPMQRQLPARTTDDFACKPPGQPGAANSNHRVGSTATNSNASFQYHALQGQHAIEGMSEFNAQHGVLESYLHRTNSPTPSFIGKFGLNMQISDPSSLLRTFSEIGDEVKGPAIPGDHHAEFATNTAPLDPSANFAGNWDPENQSMMAFNRPSINPYANLDRTEPEVGFQPVYNDLGMGAPAWPGQVHSTSAGQTDYFSRGYAPLDFQSDISNTDYPINNGSSPNFPIPPSTTKQPMIMLNNGTLLHTSQGTDFNSAPNTLNLDPILPQQQSLPRLDYSTRSSSGASESIVSPVDAPNPYSNKFGVDDRDIASCFFNDLVQQYGYEYE